MATPRRRYTVAVCRDNAGELHAILLTRPSELPYVWCVHQVRAISKAKAWEKARTAHLAHEADFLAGLARTFPQAEECRALLAQYGTLNHPAAHAHLACRTTTDGSRPHNGV